MELSGVSLDVCSRCIVYGSERCRCSVQADAFDEKTVVVLDPQSDKGRIYYLAVTLNGLRPARAVSRRLQSTTAICTLLDANVVTTLRPIAPNSERGAVC